MRKPIGLRLAVDIGSERNDVIALFVPKGVTDKTVRLYRDCIKVKVDEIVRQLALISPPEGPLEGSLVETPQSNAAPTEPPQGGCSEHG